MTDLIVAHVVCQPIVFQFLFPQQDILLLLLMAEIFWVDLQRYHLEFVTVFLHTLGKCMFLGCQKYHVGCSCVEVDSFSKV